VSRRRHFPASIFSFYFAFFIYFFEEEITTTIHAFVVLLTRAPLFQQRWACL